MLNLKSRKILNPNPQLRLRLSEYVTTIAWSPDGNRLAAATAAGEVVIVHSDRLQTTLKDEHLIVLQPPTDASVDCLSFSADGQWLAAAGQDGKIKVWEILHTPHPTLAFTLDQGNTWIDHLVWHPTKAEFAFSLGKYVQVCDPQQQDIITTVNFDQSSVLALNWHPSGEWLTVAGYQGLKMWQSHDWDEDPLNFELPTAASIMAWDYTGEYLATNTLDKMVILIQWLGDSFDGSPWRMQGFPGKIRSVTWSQILDDRKGKVKAPICVTTSGAEAVVWRRHPDDYVGWEGEVLLGHTGNVNLVGFQPQSTLLATAGVDGIVSLWTGAMHWAQTLNDSKAEITCLQWQPQGQKLAIGNAEGELILWSLSTNAKGFG